MVLGGGGDGFNQPFAKLFLEETDDQADLLQREAALAKLANDGHLGHVVERVDALVPFPRGDDDAALVPPLELARGDSGQRYYLVRCEGLLHRFRAETNPTENV